MGIYLKAGNWYIDYYVDRRRKRERIGPSKTLAKEILRKRQTDAVEGRFFPERRAASRIFGEFIEKYWELEGRNLRAKGIRGILDVFKKRFGDKSMADITPADLQAFYNETADRTSAATANRQMNFLSPIFNRAKEWRDYFGDNPAKAVRRRKEENKRLRFLSEDEIRRLLGCASTRIRPLLSCALLTGMRRGEILQLRWEQVDIARRHIYVLKTKSSKPRELPIGVKLLRMFLDLHPKTEGPVFEVPEITLRVHFRHALIAADIRDFRFHDLRHTFASHFIMRTGDLPALQKLLGHSTPDMTQRYAHLAKEHLAAKIDAFDTAMPIFPNESPNSAKAHGNPLA